MRWLTVFLLVAVVLDLIAVVSDFAQVDLVSRAVAGKTVTLAEAEANDSRQLTIAIAQLVTLVPTGLLFLVWIHRAHRNLPALGASGLKFSPGMAVGWFFVPIFNLFQPYQASKEIWKASDPNVDVWDTYAWQNAPGSGMLRNWWLLWLISNNLGGWVSRYLVAQATGLDAYLAASLALMASDLLNAIAGLLAIMVVRTIATRQEIKHALLAAPKVPPTVELHPELETAAELCARGIMYYEQKDYERAMVNLDAAIRLDPDYGDAYIDRALIYYDSGDTGRAMMDIDRVLTIEPGNLEALVLRGKWRAGNGEREEAIQDLEKALAVGLEPPSLQKGVEALLRSLRAQ